MGFLCARSLTQARVNTTGSAPWPGTLRQRGMMLTLSTITTSYSRPRKWWAPPVLFPPPIPLTTTIFSRHGLERRIQLEALVRGRELLVHVPLYIRYSQLETERMQSRATWGTYVLVDAAAHPSPSVYRGVPCVGHVGAGIEAPRAVGRGSGRVAAAEKGPDDSRAASVAGVVLLRLVSQSVSCAEVLYSNARTIGKWLTM